MSDVGKIRIEGYTTLDVQGKGLRETISGLINLGVQGVSKEGKLKIDKGNPIATRGVVKNVRRKPEVWIIAPLPELEAIRDKLLNTNIVFKKIFDEEDIPKHIKEVYPIEGCDVNLDDLPKRFEVERETEFQEMVWALQGAGYEFKKLTDAVIAHEEEKDCNRHDRILYSILQEIPQIESWIEDTEKLTSSKEKEWYVGQPPIMCIDNLLKEPPLHTIKTSNNLIGLCWQLRAELHKFRNFVFNKKKKELKESRDRLLGLEKKQGFIVELKQEIPKAFYSTELHVKYTESQNSISLKNI